jgi:pimeloyl-ACP methyl ester carboxylesterase
MVTNGTVTAGDGATIAYDDQGDGRAMVLLHGITECRAAWDPVTPTLAAHWRVVRVDLRGHGASDRRPPYDPVVMGADVAAVVAALELEHPLLVGHSMGGVVGSAYGASGSPARGIVNVDQPLELARLQEALAPIRPMLEGDEQSFREAVRLVFSLLDGPLPAGERARLDAISSPEQPVVLGVWEPVLSLPAADLDALVGGMLASIRVPYLAIHGSDPGVAYVQWLLGHIGTGNARVEVWPGHGHYPHLVDPARFFERLDQFDGGL